MVKDQDVIRAMIKKSGKKGMLAYVTGIDKVERL